MSSLTIDAYIRQCSFYYKQIITKRPPLKNSKASQPLLPVDGTAKPAFVGPFFDYENNYLFCYKVI